MLGLSTAKAVVSFRVIKAADTSLIAKNKAFVELKKHKRRDAIM